MLDNVDGVGTAFHYRTKQFCLRKISLKNCNINERILITISNYKYSLTLIGQEYLLTLLDYKDTRILYKHIYMIKIKLEYLLP